MKKKQINKASDKDIKKEDKILNLKEIKIPDLDRFSSSSCSGRASFIIDNTTEHGYCEDPRFQGIITILKTEKIKKNVYLLKIKTEFDDESY